METKKSNLVGIFVSIIIALTMVMPVGMAIDNVQETDAGMEKMYYMEFDGPVQSEWADTLELMGIDIITYVQGVGYEVKMSDIGINMASALPYVSGIREIPIETKISPDIALYGDDVVINLIGSETLKETIGEMRNYIDIFQEGSTGTGYVIRGTLKDVNYLDSIASNQDVHYISPYVAPELHGEMGMQIVGGGAWVEEHDDDNNINTPLRLTPTSYGGYVNQIGWTGAGVTIAVADTGLGDGTTGDAGHTDFQNRVIGGTDFSSNGWADGHGHGTHCTGLAAGNTYEGNAVEYAGFGPYYVGMGLGYDSELYSVRIFTAGGVWDGPADYKDIVYDAYSGGAVNVHSNSWGSASGGAYGDADSAYDQAIRDADPGTPGNQQMITFISAGNSGASTNTIGSPGNSKNSITVGGVENYAPDGTSHDNTYGNSNNPDVMYGSSSRGWTDDGRIKPDILTPGENTLSTHSPSAGDNLFGLYLEDNRYEWCTGTSQSCPTAAGGGAVIYEWYNDPANYGTPPTPATVRALMINTAIDIGTADIPNQNEGWGRMYLPTIMDQPAPFIIHQDPNELTTGVTDEYSFSYSNPAEPLKITLAYTDTYALSGANPALLNQVNLELVSPLGTIYKGNAFSGGWSVAGGSPPATFDPTSTGRDTRNNVECIYIDTGNLEGGQYTLRVIGTNVPTDCDNDGSNDQDYSLVIYNAMDVSSQGTIELDRALYTIEDTATITVSDTDLNTLPGSAQIVNININSNTEPAGETVTLTETGPDTSTFEGSITLSAINGGGILQVSDGDTVTATYNDADDGSGSPAVITDTAIIDGGVAPATGLTVEWWGLSTQDVYFEDFEGDGSPTFAELGWTTGGGSDDWEIGTPGGLGGDYGNADPNSAFSGSFSIGNDLTGIGAYPGDYEINLVADSNYIYSPAIDCSLATNTMLYFQRYLNVEQPLYDEAILDISNNGAVWNQVWANTATLTDAAWGQQSYDISTWADGQATVYIRFKIDGSDGSWQYSGWNIDDMRVEALVNGGTNDNCLNWTLSGDDGGGQNDVDHYNIYRADNSGGPWDAGAYIDGVSAGIATYTDLGRGEFDGTNWWYVIRAVDTATNEETNSNAVPEQLSGNNPPNAPINPVPADLATGIGTSPALNVDVIDPDGDTMDVYFYDASDDSQIGFDNNVASGGTAAASWNGLAESTTYTWYAVADDGEFTTQSATWSFTTIDLTPPGAVTGLTVEHYGTAAGSTTYTYSGITNPSATHVASYYDVHDMTGPGPNPQQGPFEATTTDYGYITSSDDGIRWTTLDPGNGDEAFVWSDIVVAENPAIITQIDLTFEGQCALATDYQIWAYDQVGMTWGQIGTAASASAGTDLSITRSITTNCADYISGSGILTWGAYQTTENEPVIVDYLEAVVQFSGGGGLDDNAVNWTASADDGAGADDVDHYNVYRSDVSTGPWDVAHIIDTVAATGAASYSYIDLLKGQADATYWWYVVRAVDISSNEEMNTVSVQEPTIVVPEFLIPVQAGWNFISTPLIPGDNSIPNVFTDLDGDTIWTRILSYDATDPANHWKGHNPDYGGTQSLTNVDETMGVWIFVTTVGDGFIRVGGTITSGGGIAVQAGWSIIGWATTEDGTYSLLDLKNDNLGIGITNVERFDPAQPYDLVNMLDAEFFFQGQAYWVFATNAGVLNIP